MKKDSIFWKTSAWVTVYALSCLVIMILQALICLCLKFQIKVDKILFADFINGNLVLPISNMGWIWCSICAVYCGADRASYCIKTSKMTSGKLDVGDPASLRRIIILAGLLFVIAIICNGAVDAEFDLNAWSSAFGSSILLYVGGMKAIKSVKYVDGKLDSDGDGIADEDQARDENGNLIEGQEKTLDEKTEDFVKKVETVVSSKNEDEDDDIFEK